MTTNNPGARAVIRACFLLLLCAALAPAAGCGSQGSADENDGDSTAVAQAGESAEDGDQSSEGTDSGDDGETANKQRERSTSVMAAKAIRGDLVIPVIAEGTIRARHSADIKTEISGRITKLHAREGQTVSKGAILAKLDDREYQLAVEEARAKYLQAISLLAIEEDSLSIPERPAHIQEKVRELEAMEQKGEITREERLLREIALDVDALKDGYFRADIVTARSGIAGARADLERARINLERTEIRAPFSGTVSGLEWSEGEQVGTGELFCTLVNNTDIEAEVGVLESDIGALEVGRRVLLAVPALHDTLSAQVDVISPQFDRDSRTCDVLIRIKNAEGMLRPGMFVRAIIAGETLADRLLVPREAILTRDGRPLLFKADGDRAKWIYVRLGKQNDRVVEIERVLQGGPLEPGDLVVVSDHLTLAHEAKIKVKKVLPVGDPWTTGP